MQISLGECEGVSVVRLQGDMRLWGKQGLDDKARETVYSLVAAKRKQLIFNLSGVAHIDSRGIGCLARCIATFLKHGGDLRLVAGPGLVLKTLTHLGFRRMWSVFPDEASAAGSFSL